MKIWCRFGLLVHTNSGTKCVSIVTWLLKEQWEDATARKQRNTKHEMSNIGPRDSHVCGH
jgi:hypothetical protein